MAHSNRPSSSYQAPNAALKKGFLLLDEYEVLTRTLSPEQIYGDLGFKKLSGVYRCACPFHGGNNKTTFVVFENLNFHCHSCGINGRATDYLARTHGILDLEAHNLLREIAGGSSYQAPIKRKPKKTKQITQDKSTWIEKGFSGFEEQERAYLQARFPGLNLERLQKLELIGSTKQLAGKGPKTRYDQGYRMFFPLRCVEKGHLASVSYRHTKPETLSEGMNKAVSASISTGNHGVCFGNMQSTLELARNGFGPESKLRAHFGGPVLVLAEGGPDHLILEGGLELPSIGVRGAQEATSKVRYVLEKTNFEGFILCCLHGDKAGHKALESVQKALAGQNTLKLLDTRLPSHPTLPGKKGKDLNDLFLEGGKNLLWKTLLSAVQIDLPQNPEQVVLESLLLSPLSRQRLELSPTFPGRLSELCIRAFREEKEKLQRERDRLSTIRHYQQKAREIRIHPARHRVWLGSSNFEKGWIKQKRHGKLQPSGQILDPIGQVIATLPSFHPKDPQRKELEKEFHEIESFNLPYKEVEFYEVIRDQSALMKLRPKEKLPRLSNKFSPLNSLVRCGSYGITKSAAKETLNLRPDGSGSYTRVFIECMCPACQRCSKKILFRELIENLANWPKVTRFELPFDEFGQEKLIRSGMKKILEGSSYLSIVTSYSVAFYIPRVEVENLPRRSFKRQGKQFTLSEGYEIKDFEDLARVFIDDFLSLPDFASQKIQEIKTFEDLKALADGPFLKENIRRVSRGGTKLPFNACKTTKTQSSSQDQATLCAAIEVSENRDKVVAVYARELTDNEVLELVEGNEPKIYVNSEQSVPIEGQGQEGGLVLEQEKRLALPNLINFSEEELFSWPGVLAALLVLLNGRLSLPESSRAFLTDEQRVELNSVENKIQAFLKAGGDFGALVPKGKASRKRSATAA